MQYTGPIRHGDLNIIFRNMGKKNKILAVIPARMASSRFPGKPLETILGLPMIEHVRRRTLLCRAIDEVVVATCDKDIYDCVTNYHGSVIMTSEKHEGCIDRVAEAAEHFEGDVIINVQGDMPLVHPNSLEMLVRPFAQEQEVWVTDMMGSLESDLETCNPNVVKVVVDLAVNALYYSREPIPSLKKGLLGKGMSMLKQFGINAFRREALIRFSNWERTPLEIIESVDMLRILEMGHNIRMVNSPYPAVGVDTPEDLREAEARMRKDLLFSQYN